MGLTGGHTIITNSAPYVAVGLTGGRPRAARRVRAAEGVRGGTEAVALPPQNRLWRGGLHKAHLC